MPEEIKSLFDFKDSKPKSLYKVTFGGWYQRTTLHLSEVYEYLKNSDSRLNLDKDKLKVLHAALGLGEVTRELGYLEYVKAQTIDGIDIKYYEDGLFVLETMNSDVVAAKEKLEKFYEAKFNPALSYIFSLGAPTPKILANLKTQHPTVVSYTLKDKSKFETPENIYSKVVSPDIDVYKSNDFIYIVKKDKSTVSLDEVVEMQIFFREFKDQLEKYLNIHRRVWEDISEIKDSGSIKIKEIDPIRKKLDAYQKTISLISNRINQMGSYVRTRQSIAKKAGIDEHLQNMFQYRFEVLIDTLDYIKEIWKMTTDYVNSAIQVVVELQNSATNKSIQSLTLITSMGVIAGLVAYLSRDTYPKITLVGATYLGGLLFVGWLLNKAVAVWVANRKQRLKFTKTDSDI